MTRGQLTLSRRQQKTRMALMNALLRLVVEHGLDRVTVTDIAEEAQYGRWVFYQYFESKEDAAWQTFVYWMQELDQHIVRAVEGLASPQREYQSWRIIFQAFEHQAPFFTRLDSALVSGWRNRAKEYLVTQFMGHLSAGRFQLMPDVSPPVAARLYVASLMELLEHWGQHPELGTADSLADQFYRFIFNQPPPAKGHP